MNILLTGASGFLGSRIYRKLSQQHTVTTLGRTPISHQHIDCDLSQHTPELPSGSFDFVVHSAGKAHALPRTRSEITDYEQVNVQGTTRLLTALEQLPILPKSVVYISTVLVYGRSNGSSFTETTSLDAQDPYGLSKIRAEALVLTWGKRLSVRVSILRLPLVVAEQPKGNLALLLNAIRRGYYVRVGDGITRRSMVRADDVAAIIMPAAKVGGTFNLTDGYHPTVHELEEVIAWKVRRKIPIPVVPGPLAKAIARTGDSFHAITGRRFPFDSVVLQKLTHSLTFSDELARQQLNWNPRPVLDLFR